MRCTAIAVTAKARQLYHRWDSRHRTSCYVIFSFRGPVAGRKFRRRLVRIPPHVLKTILQVLSISKFLLFERRRRIVTIIIIAIINNNSYSLEVQWLFSPRFRSYVNCLLRKQLMWYLYIHLLVYSSCTYNEPIWSYNTGVTTRRLVLASALFSV